MKYKFPHVVMVIVDNMYKEWTCGIISYNSCTSDSGQCVLQYNLSSSGDSGQYVQQVDLRHHLLITVVVVVIVDNMYKEWTCGIISYNSSNSSDSDSNSGQYCTRSGLAASFLMHRIRSLLCTTRITHVTIRKCHQMTSYNMSS